MGKFNGYGPAPGGLTGTPVSKAPVYMPNQATVPPVSKAPVYTPDRSSTDQVFRGRLEIAPIKKEPTIHEKLIAGIQQANGLTAPFQQHRAAPSFNPGQAAASINGRMSVQGSMSNPSAGDSEIARASLGDIARRQQMMMDSIDFDQNAMITQRRAVLDQLMRQNAMSNNLERLGLARRIQDGTLAEQGEMTKTIMELGVWLAMKAATSGAGG